MMWRRIKIMAAVALCGCLFAGCKKPTSPESFGQDEEKTISIQYLKSMYKNYPLRIEDNYTISGRVISTDWGGNFPYSLIMEDDTGGIEIRIGIREYFRLYKLGTQVQVRCAGLILGSYGGYLQLGGTPTDDSYECGIIASSEVNKHLIISSETTVEITDHVLKLSELSFEYVNRPVQLTGVRFVDEDGGLPWCDPDIESGYTERKLRSIYNDTDTITVRTHSGAYFAKDVIPSGSGNIAGVLQYFHGKYSLQRNYAGAISMDEP